MSNIKISQLPEYTGNTTGFYIPVNNAGETTTYKTLREYLVDTPLWYSSATGSVRYYTTPASAMTGNYNLMFGSGTNVINGASSEKNVILGAQNSSITTASGGVLLGGVQNQIQNADNCVVIGGYLHNLSATLNNNAIIGGQGATIQTDAEQSGVFVGNSNDIYASDNSTIVGGTDNIIQGGGNRNSILGGYSNDINTSGNNHAIIGGVDGEIKGEYANVIIGGNSNQVVWGENQVILGGNGNVMNSGNSSVILGGANHGCGGINNVIIGGSGNQNTGWHAFVGGITSSVSNSKSFAWGSGLSVSGEHSAALGGNNNTIDGGNYNALIGGNGNATHSGAINTSMMSTSGKTSIYDHTLHTDNLHTYYTHSFNVVNAGSVGGSVNVDCSLGSIYTFTLTANTTPNFINFRDGQQIRFVITNTTYSVPSATISGGGNVYAKNGTISPSNNSKTIYYATFISGDVYIDEHTGFDVV